MTFTALHFIYCVSTSVLPNVSGLTVYVLLYMCYCICVTVCVTVYVLLYICYCLCVTVYVLLYMCYCICVTVYVLRTGEIQIAY
jgi:hypothetical protein